MAPSPPAGVDARLVKEYHPPRPSPPPPPPHTRTHTTPPPPHHQHPTTTPPDFIPKLVDDAVRQGLIDEVVHVGGTAAMATAKDLAQKEGILSGTSGGGCLACALEVRY